MIIRDLRIIRQILDENYEKFANKYLWTSMLSIPHMYMKNIDNNPDNIGAIAFSISNL